MLPVPLSPVNVSVVEQPRLINRQYKYARLTSTFNDAQGMNVRVMLDSRSKAPARRGKPHRISSNACTTGLLAAATQLCGEGDRAESLIRNVESGMPGAGLGLAIFHTATGDFDRAVDQLLVCADDLYLFSQTLVAFPYASRLRRAAAWPLLMKRLNLPETR